VVKQFVGHHRTVKRGSPDLMQGFICGEQDRACSVMHCLYSLCPMARSDLANAEVVISGLQLFDVLSNFLKLSESKTPKGYKKLRTSKIVLCPDINATLEKNHETNRLYRK
jgi:hypothetical protein